MNLHDYVDFYQKHLGFVQTRDQELPIALFKSVKLQLTRNLELVPISRNQKNAQNSCDLGENYCSLYSPPGHSPLKTYVFHTLKKIKPIYNVRP